MPSPMIVARGCPQEGQTTRGGAHTTARGRDDIRAETEWPKSPAGGAKITERGRDGAKITAPKLGAEDDRWAEGSRRKNDASSRARNMAGAPRCLEPSP
eukprot:1794699-Pyramimonas_sp.AAC.2